jgi:hypothetical protein
MATASDFPTSKKRLAVLVLGMHRSGTSALAGVVNALGAAAPKTLLAPRPDNPRGFFESAVLAEAHDALLSSAGSHWDDWRQFDLRVAGSSVTKQHFETQKALLINEFGDAPMILIKDPRICRFVPFTLSILETLNISPTAILPVRHPLEVAYSLKRRNDFALPKSLLLWLRHVLDAEYFSRGLPRYFLPYDAFLADWKYHMDRVAEKMRITWPYSDVSNAQIEQFLTSDLYHERAATTDMHDHPDITPLVRETYDILTALAIDGENEDRLQQLDSIRSRFDESCDTFGKLATALADSLNMKVARVERDNSNLAALSGRQSLEIARLKEERESLAAMCTSLRAERKSMMAERDCLAESINRLIGGYEDGIQGSTRIANPASH